MGRRPLSFWSISSEDLLQQIQSTPQGLTGNKAKDHINRFGYNCLKPKNRTGLLTLFLDPTEAIIFLAIIFISFGRILGFVPMIPVYLIL